MEDFQTKICIYVFVNSLERDYPKIGRNATFYILPLTFRYIFFSIFSKFLPHFFLVEAIHMLFNSIKHMFSDYAFMG